MYPNWHQLSSAAISRQNDEEHFPASDVLLHPVTMNDDDASFTVSTGSHHDGVVIEEKEVQKYVEDDMSQRMTKVQALLHQQIYDDAEPLQLVSDTMDNDTLMKEQREETYNGTIPFSVSQGEYPFLQDNAPFEVELSLEMSSPLQSMSCLPKVSPIEVVLSSLVDSQTYQPTSSEKQKNGSHDLIETAQRYLSLLLSRNRAPYHHQIEGREATSIPISNESASSLWSPISYYPVELFKSYRPDARSW
jgi:hypothetical protein